MLIFSDSQEGRKLQKIHDLANRHEPADEDEGDEYWCQFNDVEGDERWFVNHGQRLLADDIKAILRGE